MAETNPNARLEAFCDAVFAIAMTLLIIDVRLPAMDSIQSNAELWRALRQLVPTIAAFALSFGVILITWVNHHAALKQVNKSSPSFMYANGFLLLTVVFMPFPTSLLGAYVFTDHAAPAVVLYEVVGIATAGAWGLLSGAAVRGGLCIDDRAAELVRVNGRKGYMACALYGGFAIAAFWFPLTIAAVTAASWIFWLVLGLRSHAAAAA